MALQDMALWVCGYCTWWTLILGAPLLSLHGALFLSQTRCAIDALATIRPGWFASRIGKLSQSQRLKMALWFGHRSARMQD